MSLPRLTDGLVEQAVAKAGSQAAGYHALCSKGYRPDEIAICSTGIKWASDIRHTVRSHAEKHELPIPASCARSREPRERKNYDDWREAFRTSVMRTGLHLSLTQPMLQFLCATADAVMWDRWGDSTLGRPDNYLTTEQSLMKRGLVRRAANRKPLDDLKASLCELTDAGKCIVDMLKATGVFVEADEAIKRRTGGGK